MTRRTEQVAALLQKEIGSYIVKLELPALTTISKVEVTPDLKLCKVWITVMGDKTKQKEVLAVLKENLFDLQRLMNHKLTMQFVPRIKFEIDHGAEYAA